MSDRQAVVTLHPLFFPDEFPFRVLTFASDLDRLGIGRASKRESKNLIPAHHNGWFDSRVVSRNHATLRASLTDKNVFLRDGGSMHGTWVNDQKVPVGQDTLVRSGDVLTFGTDVTRGAETFSPLKVRCECQWFENRDKTPAPSVQIAHTAKSSNCFSAPVDDYDSDDDYDYSSDSNSVDVVHDSVAPKMDISHHPEPNDSDSATDEVNHLSSDRSTAITPPSVKGANEQDRQNDAMDTFGRKESDDNFDRSRRGSHDLGVQQSVEAPKLPTSVESRPNIDFAMDTNRPCDAVHRDACHSVASDSPARASSIVGSEDWDPEEEQLESEDDSMSQSPFGLGAGQSNREHYSAIPGCGEPFDACDTYFKTRSSLDPEAATYPSASDEAPEIRPTREHTQKSIHDELDVGVNKPTNPALHGMAASVEPPEVEQPRDSYGNISYSPSRFQEDWAAIPKSGPVPSQSFRPTIERPLDRPLPSFQYASLPTPMDDWTPSGYPIPTTNSPFGPHFLGSCAPRVPYTDGPFVNRQSASQQDLSSQPCTGCGEAKDENEIMKSEHESGQQPSNETSPNKTRVSIADIVDASSSEPRVSHKASLKRKAADMDSDFIASEPAALRALCSLSESAPNEDRASQGAQQQILLNDLKNTSSQVMDCTQTEQSLSTDDDDEPPRKRAKTAEDKGGRRIAGYAATALAGAIAGGLGTVALLASLPPEFFQ